MALREVLKYKKVSKVTIVELDPEVTRLFTVNPEFCNLNDSSFHDLRVRVINDDMFSYLKKSKEKFDIILFDFPDPHHDNIAKLYSVQMYTLAKHSLNKKGYLVTQSTSPYFNRKSFLTIHNTLKDVFSKGVVPYKVYMPTFGVWGFNLVSDFASAEELKMKLENFSTDVKTQYLNRAIVQSSVRWSDLIWHGSGKLPVNSVLKPILVKAYNSRE